jgi:hypothetical protein
MVGWGIGSIFPHFFRGFWDFRPAKVIFVSILNYFSNFCYTRQKCSHFFLKKNEKPQKKDYEGTKGYVTVVSSNHLKFEV